MDKIVYDDLAETLLDMLARRAGGAKVSIGFFFATVVDEHCSAYGWLEARRGSECARIYPGNKFHAKVLDMLLSFTADGFDIIMHKVKGRKYSERVFMEAGTTYESLLVMRDLTMQ